MRTTLRVCAKGMQEILILEKYKKFKKSLV
jgi:hypothetical protein